jgi:glycine/D-amino acid oxidase-like deaminating enzyme
MTGDGDFILDRHPLHPNVIIGGGFSGTGFKFGPTTGKILARMALGMSNAEFDLTPFKIDRHIGSKSKL